MDTRGVPAPVLVGEGKVPREPHTWLASGEASRTFALVPTSGQI